MNTLTFRKLLVILVHALIGWALCFATMGIGMSVTTNQTTLIVHAVAAPLFFVGISLVYFTRFHYTSPLSTALMFTGIVVFFDFFLVALIILKSLEMFTSVLGTWLPFTEIFLATYLTGYVLSRRSKIQTHPMPTR